MAIRLDKRIDLSLVIPVHNNETTVRTGIEACRRMLRSVCGKSEIIVGEDAGTDRSLELLTSQFGGDKTIRIYRHDKNMGIGKNIYFLYGKATLPYTALFSIDGDWDVRDLMNLIRREQESNADILIGKRIKKEGYSFDRHVISYLFNFLSRALFGIDTVDAGSIKIFKTHWFNDLKLLSRSQFFEAEMIIRIGRAGGRIESYPVHYHKKTHGKGTWLRLRSALLAFGDLVRVLARGF